MKIDTSRSKHLGNVSRQNTMHHRIVRGTLIPDSSINNYYKCAKVLLWNINKAGFTSVKSIRMRKHPASPLTVTVLTPEAPSTNIKQIFSQSISPYQHLHTAFNLWSVAQNPVQAVTTETKTR